MSSPQSMDMELARAEYLLETAYPGRKILVHLVQSEAAVPPRTVEVQNGGSENAPVEVQVFDTLEIGDATSDELPVSVVVHLPNRAPLVSPGPENEETPNVRRFVRPVVAISPMLFERLKYALDRYYEKRLLAGNGVEVLRNAEELPVSEDLTQKLREEGAPKRPAILIGFHWLEHGGAEKLAFDTVEWALAAGLRVIVVAAHDAEHRLAHRLPEHPDVVFARMDRYVPAVRTREFLRNLVLRENVWAVHVHHCEPLLAALPAIRAVAPYIHIISSTHITEYKDGGHVYKSGRFSHYIDTQHVISRQLGEVSREKFGLGEKILLGRLLEHGEAQSEISPFTPLLATQPLKILFVGRMAYQKRPLLVAMMMRALHKWAGKQGVELNFDIVGEGPYLRLFKSLLGRYDLGGMTNLHSADADIPALMEQSDILLLPSANEGLALVCYEAIQAGVLPISSDVGAQSELIPTELLLERDPAKALKSVVRIVDRLVNDAAFHQKAVDGLKSRYDAIASDPTARDVLSAIYNRVASAGGEK